MAKVRLLSTMKPLVGLVPEIESPSKPIAANVRIFWTAASLFVFLVCSQIPIFGVVRSKSNDMFYWARVMLASNRGSLMELGISPIVTASMIVQLLVGMKFVDFNPTHKEDRELLATAQKVLGLVICFGEAVACVLTGTYGKLGWLMGSIVVAQLLVSGFIVLLLDDLMTHGYGLGGGISLFISVNICEKIIWAMASPTLLQTENGVQFEGALIAFVHLMFTKKNKLAALREAFYRSGAPNMTNVISTFGILSLVIYLQCFRLEVPIRHTQNGGQTGTYPIKLFYTSNLPIIGQTAIFSNIFGISQFLYRHYRNNPVVNMIGQWQMLPGGVQKPVGGLLYYVSAPSRTIELLTQPLHTLVYVTCILGTCAMFSRYWLQFSGSSPRDVAKTLRDQNLMITGHRDVSMYKVLNAYIPTAATMGGLCLGGLSIIADITGAIGSGTGILLAVSVIFQYYEIIVRERRGMQ